MRKPGGPTSGEQEGPVSGCGGQEDSRSGGRVPDLGSLSCLLGWEHSGQLARCCQSTPCFWPAPHVQPAAQNVPIQGQSSASSPPNPQNLNCISNLNEKNKKATNEEHISQKDHLIQFQVLTQGQSPPNKPTLPNMLLDYALLMHFKQHLEGLVCSDKGY